MTAQGSGKGRTGQLDVLQSKRDPRHLIGLGIEDCRVVWRERRATLGSEGGKAVTELMAASVFPKQCRQWQHEGKGSGR